MPEPRSCSLCTIPRLYREIAYVQKGYLSDVPDLNYYFIKRKSWTGFIYYRNIRSSSALEAYHLHLRAAQHPCAKGSGSRVELSRTLLFDFAWNVRAAVVANHQPDAGHFNLWLVDALVDLFEGWIDGDDVPTALRSWTRTDTTIEPITFRGIHHATTQGLAAQGVQPRELSPLKSREERKQVLKHPLLLARGDAAGIERETGIVTSDRILQALAAQLAIEARTRQLLEAHGVQNLGQHLRRDGQAPTAVRLPPAPPQPPPRPEEVGPLPLDADAVRLPGRVVTGGVVAMDAELPAEEAEEEGEGGGEMEDGEMEAEEAEEDEEVEEEEEAEEDEERRAAEAPMKAKRSDFTAEEWVARNKERARKRQRKSRGGGPE